MGHAILGNVTLNFTVGWRYADLMNIYGDRGNILTLLRRAEWHGYDAKVVELGRGAATQMDDIDVAHLACGAPSKLDDSRLITVPLGPSEQGEDVAAVAVDVHQVGVQPPDGEVQRHVSQYGVAHPRLTSSALRSSIAVYVQSR